jgi:2,5-diketo-D-gluconate reductase A
VDRMSDVELRTGRLMPCMGLGTWQLTHDTAGTVAAALELGYRLIDTSGDYGTQAGIGEAIRGRGVARDKVYLVTKVEETDNAYEATRSNLAELQLDYADLMLIHRPPRQGAGEDLWRGLMRARKEGLVRDIGVSNYSAELIDALIEATGETPAVNQVEWSPFGFSDRMLDHAGRNGIVLQAYSPLTRGKRLNEGGLTRIAGRYGKSSAQLLIRWNLQRGTVPLPKANRQRHLKENIDVFDFEIGADDMARLSELNEEYSSLGTLPYV